jgi:hypothetical protein
LGLDPEDSESFREDMDICTRVEREPRRGERRRLWRPSLVFHARRAGLASPGETPADVLILARQLRSPDPKFLAYLKEMLGTERVESWIRELEGDLWENPKSGKRSWRGGVDGLKRRVRRAARGAANQGRRKGQKDARPRARREPHPDSENARVDKLIADWISQGHPRRGLLKAARAQVEIETGKGHEALKKRRQRESREARAARAE